MNAKHYRRMSRPAKRFYFGMLVVFGVLSLTALIAGWWFFALANVALAGAFVGSAPFVLARGWQAPEPKPTRRPVVRRRR